jgi:hypothetical protein
MNSDLHYYKNRISIQVNCDVVSHKQLNVKQQLPGATHAKVCDMNAKIPINLWVLDMYILITGYDIMV